MLASGVIRWRCSWCGAPCSGNDERRDDFRDRRFRRADRDLRSFEIRKWRAGEMKRRMRLLLCGLVPLQWLAFGDAARFGPDGIVRAGIALGLFHSLQYHRLLWFHNKNRYQTPDARAKHGFAAVLAQKFGYYFAAAVGLYWVGDILPATLLPWQWLPASLWGLAFMHYLLDSKIWRVRGDKELAAALHL